MLFVCTYNKQFSGSAQKMVSSFLRTQTEGNLLLCLEDYEEMVAELPKSDRILTFNLSQYPYLKGWLNANADVIPVRHGGKLAGCKCQPVDNWTGHTPKCANGFFRGRASQWFRKIASLKYVHDTFSCHKYVLGIDCDVEFRRNIPESMVDTYLGAYDAFVHQGPYRRSHSLYVEAGLIGFNFGRKGGGFLSHVFDFFANRNFRSFDRWDDSYAYSYVASKNIFAVNDVAVGELPANVNPSQAMLRGPFADFVIHNKGSHVDLIK